MPDVLTNPPAVSHVRGFLEQSLCAIDDAVLVLAASMVHAATVTCARLRPPRVPPRIAAAVEVEKVAGVSDAFCTS